MLHSPIVERHDRPPSALAFMARALLPSPGLSRGVPALVERWSGLRVESEHLAALQEATGLADGPAISILYPHVVGFRLQMALLTHRAFPLPIWNALQIRNRLVRHRSFGEGDTLDLETRVGPHRMVEKGIEIDLQSRLTRGDECVWESEVSYFFRGRFGAADADAERTSAAKTAPDLAGAPPTSTESFKMPLEGRFRFGQLTGDYNGIHQWDWYARRLRFPAAFAHPQRTAGLCMARVAPPQSERQSLELWIKGPVFYGADVVLRSQPADSGVELGLALAGEPRMALLARWLAA